jgi:calcineurin-like phosphoesterase family protein
MWLYLSSLQTSMGDSRLVGFLGDLVNSAEKSNKTIHQLKILASFKASTPGNHHHKA